MPSRKLSLPHLKASEILTLSEADAERVNSMRGHERTQEQAYADTLRWLEGEGPRPDCVCFLECIPGQTENELPQWVYQPYVIPDYLRKASKAILIHELLNRFTPANRPRVSRKAAWQAWAKHRAELLFKKPGKHRMSALQLAMKLCDVDVWNDGKDKFIFPFTRGKTTKNESISAGRMYDFLREAYSFPHANP